MTRSHVSLAWQARAGGFWLASVWVEKGVRLRIGFFSSHTPTDHVKPQSPLPPPVTNRGPAWREKPESAEGRTCGGRKCRPSEERAPRWGLRSTHEPATHPGHSAGSLGAQEAGGRGGRVLEDSKTALEECL